MCICKYAMKYAVAAWERTQNVAVWKHAPISKQRGWARCNKSKCGESFLFSHLLDFTTQTHTCTIKCNLFSLMHRSKYTVSWHLGRDYIQKLTPFRFNHLCHTHALTTMTKQRLHTRSYTHTHTHKVTSDNTHKSTWKGTEHTHTHMARSGLFLLSLDTTTLYLCSSDRVSCLSLGDWHLCRALHTAPSFSSLLVSAFLSFLKTVYLLLSLSSTTGLLEN